MAKFLNRERVLAQIAKIPAVQKAKVQARGDIENRYLAGKVEAAAPVGTDLEKQPGALRESVHAEPGKRQLAWRVVIDARDAKGSFIAKHVEFGHMAKDGGHVPPVPFAHPTLRVEMPGIHRRMAKAGLEGAREAAPDLVK